MHGRGVGTDWVLTQPTDGLFLVSEPGGFHYCTYCNCTSVCRAVASIPSISLSDCLSFISLFVCGGGYVYESWCVGMNKTHVYGTMYSCFILFCLLLWSTLKLQCIKCAFLINLTLRDQQRVWVYSFLWEKWMGSQSRTNSSTAVIRVKMGPMFHKLQKLTLRPLSAPAIDSYPTSLSASL